MWIFTVNGIRYSISLKTSQVVSLLIKQLKRISGESFPLVSFLHSLRNTSLSAINSQTANAITRSFYHTNNED